jgi:hypothetical protein
MTVFARELTFLFLNQSGVGTVSAICRDCILECHVAAQTAAILSAESALRNTLQKLVTQRRDEKILALVARISCRITASRLSIMTRCSAVKIHHALSVGARSVIDCSSITATKLGESVAYSVHDVMPLWARSIVMAS